MMLKPLAPSVSMAVYVPDEATDTIVAKYASGAHAALLRSFRSSPGEGIVGWVAANRRMASNAEPAIDFGHAVATLDPPLLSSIAIPLVHEGSLRAVLSLYASTRQAFTDDHARLLELMAPSLAASLAAADQAQGFGPGAARRTVSRDLRLLKRLRAAGA
jgi:GAF domain-containing protein